MKEAFPAEIDQLSLAERVATLNNEAEAIVGRYHQIFWEARAKGATYVRVLKTENLPEAVLEELTALAEDLGLFGQEIVATSNSAKFYKVNQRTGRLTAQKCVRVQGRLIDFMYLEHRDNFAYVLEQPPIELEHPHASGTIYPSAYALVEKGDLALPRES